MRSPCFSPPRSSIRCFLRALYLPSTRTEPPQSPEPAGVDKLQAPTQHAPCLPYLLESDAPTPPGSGSPSPAPPGLDPCP